MLPSGYFEIDLDFDSEIPKVSTKSKINFNSSVTANIDGALDFQFRSEFLRNLECPQEECRLSDFQLNYRINFGQSG